MSRPSAVPRALFRGLVDDAAMFPPGNASAEEAVSEHRRHRESWYASLIGPLVVPDTALAQIGRAAGPAEPIAVSVVTSGGAGGVAALAGRTVPGVQVVAVETALRDLDDLAGNAGRVVAAAAELDPGVSVYVELPYAHGWVQAVAEIEAAGLFGKLRTGGTEPDAHPPASRLAEQLSVLVEADLGFKATAGLHHAWPAVGRNDRGDALPQHGFLTLMMALDALIDGAEVTEAEELLHLTDRERLTAAVESWDLGSQDRVRRRLRSFGCCGVTDPVADLVELELLDAPT